MLFDVRKVTKEDETFLWLMLYEAAHMEEAGEPFEGIQKHPALARYVEGWGGLHDHGIVTIDRSIQKPVSAVWVRMLTSEDNRGYGFVRHGVPELVMATLKLYRRNGAALLAMCSLLDYLKGHYSALSLSVRANNTPAVTLYEKLGFQRVSDSEIINRAGIKAFTMILDI